MQIACDELSHCPQDSCGCHRIILSQTDPPFLSFMFLWDKQNIFESLSAIYLLFFASLTQAKQVWEYLAILGEEVGGKCQWLGVI